MKFYFARPGDETDADLDARPRWYLPGAGLCPQCGVDPEGGSDGRYPCVDLSSLPAADLKLLENAIHVRREEFLRLRELVRPHAPPDAILKPGAGFGQLRGTARGYFGLFHMQSSDSVVVRPGIMTGGRGIKLCPMTELRTKTELLALQLEHHGLRHESCLLAESPPCSVCGLRRVIGEGGPEWQFVLDGRSVSDPEIPDLFSIKDGSGLTFATERFVEWALELPQQHKEPLGIRFEEVKVVGG